MDIAEVDFHRLLPPMCRQRKRCGSGSPYPRSITFSGAAVRDVPRVGSKGAHSSHSHGGTSLNAGLRCGAGEATSKLAPADGANRLRALAQACSRRIPAASQGT